MFGSRESEESSVETALQAARETPVDPFVLKQRDIGLHAIKRALGYFGTPERVDQRQPIAFFVGRSNAT